MSFDDFCKNHVKSKLKKFDMVEIKIKFKNLIIPKFRKMAYKQLQY